MILHLAKKLESDAAFQVRFHLFMTWFWFLSMPIVGGIVPHNTPAQWVELAILEVSLYANFATEFGALSASQASQKADRGNNNGHGI